MYRATYKEFQILPQKNEKLKRTAKKAIKPVVPRQSVFFTAPKLLTPRHEYAPYVPHSSSLPCCQCLRGQKGLVALICDIL